jgi:hypothetical protein
MKMKCTILKGRKIKKHKHIFYECLVKVRTNIDHFIYVVIPKANIPLILNLINKDEVESITPMVQFNVIPFEYLPDLSEIEKGEFPNVTIDDVYEFMDDEEYKELIVDLLKYDCSTIRVKVKES